MHEIKTRVLIVGGGLGAVAAALSCGRLGIPSILVSDQQWLGGQLTSQGVPPDEHPWIESTGSTAAYRELRHRIRETYRRMGVVSEAARLNPLLNPGGGHVSPITHDPRVAAGVVEEMLLPYRMSGVLQLRRGLVPIAAHTDGDRISAVDFGSLVVTADFVLDATETGALLPLAGVEYRIGAESQREFDEPHAPEEAQPENQQAISWCCALRYRGDGDAGLVPRPDAYEVWKARAAAHWPGPQLSFDVIDPFTLKERTSRLFGTGKNPMSRDGGLWIFRRIASPRNLTGALATTDMTMLNWPMIDYWEAPIVDNSSASQALADARSLTLSFVHWLQTEAPRPDGGEGYPEVALAADVFETEHGLAREAYYRESRRIVARTTITENDIASGVLGGSDGPGLARQFSDSVGLASYRIDLHPSTGGDSYIDIESYPAQIPLGALIPQRVTNLLAASKNIGTTHLSNGMYRVHPAEWNIGEAAGALAAWCALGGHHPTEIAESGELTEEFQLMLHDRLGFDLEWPSYIRTIARYAPQLQWTIREKRNGWRTG